MGKNTESDDIAIRFKNLIEAAYEKTGLQVVVLVDEYDKPLLQNVDNPEEEDKIRSVLKGFYGNLKGEDQYWRCFPLRRYFRCNSFRHFPFLFFG